MNTATIHLLFALLTCIYYRITESLSMLCSLCLANALLYPRSLSGFTSSLLTHSLTRCSSVTLCPSREGRQPHSQASGRQRWGHDDAPGGQPRSQARRLAGAVHQRRRHAGFRGGGRADRFNSQEGVVAGVLHVEAGRDAGQGIQPQGGCAPLHPGEVLGYHMQGNTVLLCVRMMN